MKGLSYTTDLMVASVILIAVVGLVVFAQTFLASDWNMLYKLKLIAHDSALYFSRNIDKVNNCDSVMGQLVPQSAGYEVTLNGDVKCSRGDITKATKVVSSFAYGVKENSLLNDNDDSYYYKTCDATTRTGEPIYRCNINSKYKRDEVLNPVSEGLIEEGVIEVKVFV